MYLDKLQVGKKIDKVFKAIVEPNTHGNILCLFVRTSCGSTKLIQMFI